MVVFFCFGGVKRTINYFFVLFCFESDKPPLLLLCLPPYQPTAKKTVSDVSEIRTSKARFIDAEKELQLYKSE